MTGSTFTISNYGSSGTLFGTPIINQPEAAILGIGAIEKEPTILETEAGDVIAVRHKIYLSFSYDIGSSMGCWLEPSYSISHIT